MKRATLGTLVVVELGGVWPDCMGDLLGRAPRRVVSELEGEQGGTFAGRLVTYCSELRRQRLRPERVLVVCNERTDAAQHEDRRRASKALLETMSGQADAQVVFVASAQSGERLRQSLHSIAAELGGKRNASAGAVRVHFDSPRELPSSPSSPAVARVA